MDTGVDPTPDTGAVVERAALDGGTGADLSQRGHGTVMAQLMAGGVNGWGSVGIWSALRIVSIRALRPGEEGMFFDDYKRAIDACKEHEGQRIRAIELAVGHTGATPQQIAVLEDYATKARNDGVSIVAAAGNDGGAVNYPAATDGVAGVGAVGPSGALCDFSSRGGGLDLSALGCGASMAERDGSLSSAAGTSGASATAAAVLAAIRSYRPDLSAAAAEQALAGAARMAPAGPVLDVSAAFRQLGLGEVVDAGEAARPRTLAEPGRAGGLSDQRRLPTPKLSSLRYRRGHLTVRLSNRPRGAVVVGRAFYSARAGGGGRSRGRGVESGSSTVRVRLPGPWRRVRLAYRHYDAPPSKALIVKPARN